MRLVARVLSAVVVLATAVVSAIAVATPAEAATDVNCRSLPGAGSFSNPIRLGVVTNQFIARGCPALTSGSGFNHRYFRFTITRAARNPSIAGANFRLRPGAVSAVHPRLATTSGVTLARSLATGVWTGTSPNFTGRYLPIGGLPAGTYILGVEKLDSPLRSLRTPSFDVVLIVN